ncbi:MULTISPECIES: CDP-glycerol glycerophosphotransferase family protein [Motilimonas]|uniref:CDP-glycerol glycerophosphotransferase family protein n=1 Tax=Motilimonas cestriensis TaxID=2742685 RepID=A0ABS8W8C0_9GAMM|nr:MULTISPECIES: CDP-glycerol glycerophosphotransferase family protein [Motilimonas]MCE2594006.1 CDP-glycerol glycerophosphotransferase family protein [Motilimonas cestriensis]MDO6526831.1 CDP-glycerol glycerophosphotransferase family protein [Motilimonas sp. 1_MG-2023]
MIKTINGTSGPYRFLFYIEQNYSFAILRPLQQVAKAEGNEVAWLLVGDEVSPTFLADDEVALVDVAAAVNYQADAVFVPGDRVPAFIPGLKVQVFHGLNESKRGNVYPERGLFDLYCTEGHERSATLQAQANKRGYFQVQETGWLKLDSLFNYQCEQTWPRPQILFASTFSPTLSCAEAVYEQIKLLSQSDQWHWLITLHPKMDHTTVAKYRALENANLSFFENDQVIPLQHRADLMVCDNSSVFQEFLLLNKPVVTVNNRDPQACFINITEPEKLADAIELGLNPSHELLAAIAQYGPSVTPYLDGQSAPRVLKVVSDILQRGWQDKKPKNVYRNFQMRQKLNYWKW